MRQFNQTNVFYCDFGQNKLPLIIGFITPSLLFLSEMGSPPKKDDSRTMQKRTFFIGLLIFYLGLCCLLTTNNLGLRPDVRSEVMETRVKLTTTGFPDYNALCVKENFASDHNFDQRNLTVRYETRSTKPRPFSDQTFYKEKRSETIDRSRETAMFPFSAIFLGKLQNPIILVSHFAFVKYSSWAGNSTKIRPPPVF